MYDGSTRLFFTLGQPASIIRIPRVMAPVFEAIGLNAVWLAMDVAPADLGRVLDGLRRVGNLGGLTITMPHKQAVLGLADRVSDLARASGAANLLRFEADGSITVDVADGIGFVRGLEARGFAPKGRSAFLLGTGGAGSAIAAALCAAGVSRLVVGERDYARAEACLARLAAVYPGVTLERADRPPADVDVAINATPCGLRETDPLPFDPAALSPCTFVAEVIMSPPVTRLLASARELGFSTSVGRDMLDHQISLYLDFFGYAHDPAAVIAALPREATERGA
jgi:shikimate dehydrogenase